jgi:formate/nitrite transporter FocA (FNT family)
MNWILLVILGIIALFATASNANIVALGILILANILVWMKWLYVPTLGKVLAILTLLVFFVWIMFTHRTGGENG